MIELIEQHILLFWLCIGALFLIIEAFGVSGIGLFFAGFAAFTVGGLLHFEVIELADHTRQGMLFFAFTFVWAVLLWLPLKKFRQGRQDETYNNMTGDLATVSNKALVAGKIGTVSWSGTSMKARLESDTVKELPKGADVTIIRVEGTTLIVAPTES